MENTSQFKPKSFAVIGAGPVGCIVSAFLTGAGYEVTLCDVVQDLIQPALDPGITIEGAVNFRNRKVTRVCNSIDDVAQYNPDVIIITVKANALPLIASAISEFINEHMYVVSWQNGIDTELALANVFGSRQVMRAVVNYGCGLVGPCHVKMLFHHTPHFIQSVDPASAEAAASIAEALTKCDLHTESTEELVGKIWRKGVMNACMNPVCAVTGFTMRQAMSDPIVFDLVDALTKECIKVARANEILLGKDFYPYAMEYMGKAGDHKPSMLMDIENNRRTEIDFLNGKFIEYGKRAGIETPYNQMIRGLVKAIEPK